MLLHYHNRFVMILQMRINLAVQHFNLFMFLLRVEVVGESLQCTIHAHAREARPASGVISCHKDLSSQLLQGRCKMDHNVEQASPAYKWGKHGHSQSELSQVGDQQSR